MAAVKEISASYKNSFKIYVNGSDTFHTFEYSETLSVAENDDLNAVKYQLWENVINEVTKQGQAVIQSAMQQRR
jgi:hypothetical protein